MINVLSCTINYVKPRCKFRFLAAVTSRPSTISSSLLQTVIKAVENVHVQQCPTAVQYLELLAWNLDMPKRRLGKKLPCQPHTKKLKRPGIETQTEIMGGLCSKCVGGNKPEAEVTEHSSLLSHQAGGAGTSAVNTSSANLDTVSTTETHVVHRLTEPLEEPVTEQKLTEPLAEPATEHKEVEPVAERNLTEPVVEPVIAQELSECLVEPLIEQKLREPFAEFVADLEQKLKEPVKEMGMSAAQEASTSTELAGSHSKSDEDILAPVSSSVKCDEVGRPEQERSTDATVPLSDYHEYRDTTEVTTNEKTEADLSIEAKSKHTILPKDLLEGVTSLVSEKCDSDGSWVTNVVTLDSSAETDGDDSELLGDLFTATWGDDDTTRVTAPHTVEEDSINHKKKKKPKKEKPQPNYFVAVQITNPEIHCGLSNVQLSVLRTDPRMKEVMNRLSTLHLTVLVLSLNSQEDIDRAGAVLESCGCELRERFKADLPVLEVEGLGTFRNQVVFAKVNPGDALDQLMFIHEYVKRQMLSHGVWVTDTSPMTPHITVMKMSKVKGNFRRNVAKKIDPALYHGFKDSVFGTETVSRLQLCAMLKPKDKLGYYQVPHTLHLGQGEVTLEEFSSSLSKSLVASALDRMKSDKMREFGGQDRGKGKKETSQGNNAGRTEKGS